MKPYKAVLIQGQGWHVVGNGESNPVTAKTIALAMARQMNYDYKRIAIKYSQGSEPW